MPRPKGSKNKKKAAKRKGNKAVTGSSSNIFGTFELQIANLQNEKKSMLQNIKTIDKAISLLKKLSK